MTIATTWTLDSDTNSAEALGEYFGLIFATPSEAEDAADHLRDMGTEDVAVVESDTGLTAVDSHGEWHVADKNGGVWSPEEPAKSAVAALVACHNTPGVGTWMD